MRQTRVVHLEVGGEGLDFLGFHHRLVRSRGLGGKPRVTFLARWPSDREIDLWYSGKKKDFGGNIQA